MQHGAAFFIPLKSVKILKPRGGLVKDVDCLNNTARRRQWSLCTRLFSGDDYSSGDRSRRQSPVPEWEVGGFSKTHNKTKTVNVARIPCKCVAVHAANNPREMHIFMRRFVRENQIHLFKGGLGRCVPNWIFLYKIVLSEMWVFTRSGIKIPIISIQMNNELLTLSDKHHIHEEEAAMWLLRAS